MAELPQEFFKRIEEACRLAEEKAYQQGRADKYREITSEYMLLTEKQVEEIRADAIDEFKDKLIELYHKRYMHDIYLDDIDDIVIQLKEKKNESC